MKYTQFTAARADTGVPLPYAKATVYYTGTNTLAPLYNASNGGISNPTFADGAGLLQFKTADGTYDIQIASADGAYLVPPITQFQIVDLMGLRGSITSGRIGTATWSELSGVAAANGQLAEVPDTDTGTHTDPVSGAGGTANSGVYRRATAGWQRIYDYGDIGRVKRSGDSMYGILSMQGNRIESLGPPDSVDDAVNWQFLETGSWTRNADLSMGNKRLVSLGSATGDNDAVSRIFGDQRYVRFTSAQSIDIGMRRLENVGNPDTDDDATTLGYIKTGNWARGADLSMGGHRLSDVAVPNADDDAISRRYLFGGTITRTAPINMGGYRLESLGNPDTDDDAVNLGYLKSTLSAPGSDVFVDESNLKGSYATVVSMAALFAIPDNRRSAGMRRKVLGNDGTGVTGRVFELGGDLSNTGWQGLPTAIETANLAKAGIGEQLNSSTGFVSAVAGASPINVNGQGMGFTIPAGSAGSLSLFARYAAVPPEWVARYIGVTLRVKMAAQVTPNFVAEKPPLTSTLPVYVRKDGANAYAGTLVRSEVINGILYREGLYTIVGGETSIGSAFQTGNNSNANTHSFQANSLSIVVESVPANATYTASDAAAFFRDLPMRSGIGPILSEVAPSIIQNGGTTSLADANGINWGFTIPVGQTGNNAALRAPLPLDSKSFLALSGKTLRVAFVVDTSAVFDRTLGVNFHYLKADGSEALVSTPQLLGYVQLSPTRRIYSALAVMPTFVGTETTIIPYMFSLDTAVVADNAQTWLISDITVSAHLADSRESAEQTNTKVRYFRLLSKLSTGGITADQIVAAGGITGGNLPTATAGFGVLSNSTTIDLNKKFGLMPGTDVTDLIQGLVNQLTSGDNLDIVFSTPGTYTVNGALQTGTALGYAYSGSILLPAVSWDGDKATPLRIRSMSRNANGDPANGEAGGGVTLSTNQNTAGGYMFAAVPYSAKYGYQFTGVMPYIEDITFSHPNNPQGGSLNLETCLRASLDHIICKQGNINSANFKTGTTEAIILPQSKSNGFVTLRNSQIRGWGYGVRLSEHNVLDNIEISYCNAAFTFYAGGHANKFSYVDIEECTTIFYHKGTATVLVVYGDLDIENVAGGTSFAPTSFAKFDNTSSGIFYQLDVFCDPTGSLGITGGGTLQGSINNIGYNRKLTHPVDTMLRLANTLLPSGTAPGLTWPTMDPWRVLNGSFAFTAAGVCKGTGGGSNQAFLPARDGIIGGCSRRVQMSVTTPSNGYNASVIGNRQQSGALAAWANINAGNLTFGIGSAPGTGLIKTIPGVIAASTAYKIALDLYIVGGTLLRVDVVLNGVVQYSHACSAAQQITLAGTDPYLMDGVYFTDTTTSLTGFAVIPLAPAPANLSSGTATLVGGTVTVALQNATANTVIRLSRQASGGTPGQLSTTVTAGTGFTINSTSNTDTSTVFWEVVNI